MKRREAIDQIPTRYLIYGEASRRHFTSQFMSPLRSLELLEESHKPHWLHETTSVDYLTDLGHEDFITITILTDLICHGSYLLRIHDVSPGPSPTTIIHLLLVTRRAGHTAFSVGYLIL